MEGKRVSWVELYLDLVFVLAIGQIAHLIVAEPEMHSVWVALGLFFVLWWTWVGFAVLYNRHGADEPLQRLLSWPGACRRAWPRSRSSRPRRATSRCSRSASPSRGSCSAVAQRAAGGGTSCCSCGSRARCLTSAALFARLGLGAGAVPYVLWVIGIGIESGAMLNEDREATRRARASTTGARWARPTRPRRSTRITSPSASGSS